MKNNFYKRLNKWNRHPELDSGSQAKHPILINRFPHSRLTLSQSIPPAGGAFSHESSME